MSMLPQSSLLGKLEILEVYEFYDRPVLFSCRNVSGNLYLAVLVNEDRSIEKWLYVGVSKRRFDQIRSGGIDLHDAFFEAEDNVVFEVEIRDVEGSADISIIPISSGSLADDRLPMKGEVLNFEVATLPEFAETISLRAYQEKREVVRIHLDFSDINRTEAPASLLGGILASLQETMNAIGQALVGQATERGIISSEVLSKTEMRVVGIAPGSFQVELVSADYVNLFNESDTGQILDEFILLLNLSSKPEELKDQLTHLKIRAASKYLAFLQSLPEKIKNTKITWGSPKSEKGGEAQLSALQVKNAITTIQQSELQEPEDFYIKGQLIGANIDKKTYEIWVENVIKGQRQSFSGKVSEIAMRDLSTATLSQTYNATIRKITSLKPITGEVEEKYELIDLRK